ncbi:MAG: manganese efflux pump, partial [FCB group bacterium]|nr:manganese efflux pump [FCB group bacterium]
MTYYELAILALALAIDAFSVGSAVGLTCHRPRQIFRLSWHFGLFQALMPLIGALAGSLMMVVIQGWDHWVAFFILLGLGIKMIAGAFKKEEENTRPVDLTKGWSLISLSIAVSIDALAAGIT